MDNPRPMNHMHGRMTRVYCGPDAKLTAAYPDAYEKQPRGVSCGPILIYQNIIF